MIEYIKPFLEEHRNLIIFGALALLNEVWQYWLGKTDKVKAGSNLELILLTLKKLKSVVKK